MNSNTIKINRIVIPFSFPPWAILIIHPQSMLRVGLPYIYILYIYTTYTYNQFHSPEYHHVDVRRPHTAVTVVIIYASLTLIPVSVWFGSRERCSCLLEMDNIQSFSTSQLLKCNARCPHLPHHTLTNCELIIFQDMEKQTPFQPRIWDLFQTSIYQTVG